MWHPGECIDVLSWSKEAMPSRSLSDSVHRSNLRDTATPVMYTVVCVIEPELFIEISPSSPRVTENR